MLAPVRLALVKSASPKMASSRLAFVRFLEFRLILFRGIRRFTASSKQVLKSLKKPENNVSSVSLVINL